MSTTANDTRIGAAAAASISVPIRRQRRCGRLADFWSALVAAGLLSGCAAVRDPRADSARVLEPLRAGDLARAASNAKVSMRLHEDDGDAVLAALEAGAVLQAAGRTAESIAAFDQAYAKINELDARAVVSARDAAGEVAAIVTNPRVLPYRGMQSDRIMLHSLQAINYLSLGDKNAARVELNRAYGRQQDAVAHFEKAIRNAEERMQRRNLDPQDVNLKLARQQLRHLGTPPLTAYRDFVNPLTTYLDALFYMGTAENGSDAERARKNLERMAGFSADPRAFEAERAWLSASDRAPAVVVLALEGLAPERQQWRLDFPLPTRPITHAGLALPRLHFREAGRGLSVTGADAPRLVADVDAVVAREFDESYDAFVMRAVAGAAAKSVAQVQLRKNLGRTAWILGALGSIELTGADLRTWQTAPARAVRVWMNRPANGSLTLQAAPNCAPQTVFLPEAPLVLVVVRRLSNAQPYLTVIPLE